VDRPGLLRARAQPASRRATGARPARRRVPAGYRRPRGTPGIGRSTAGAILALATGTRHAILDGNVKRVLARHYAVDGAPDDNATLETLWELAEANTPREDVGIYTQAIMDLGATLCTRGQPRCDECPIARTAARALEDRTAKHAGRRSANARYRRCGTR
jgi:A/G-specific adenine glycosylase